MHLEKYTTCHLDLKDDNLLVSASGRLCMCDFGTAVRFESRAMQLPYTAGMSPGGNQQHLAPEVLSAFLRCSRGQLPQPAHDGSQPAPAVVDYSHQTVRSLGCDDCL